MKRFNHCRPRTGASLALALALCAAAAATAAATPRPQQIAPTSALGTHARTTLPALTICNQVATTYTLSAKSQTIQFPLDCASNGSSRLPAVDDRTLESPAQTLTVCENISPIQATGGCVNQPSVSDSPCSNANGTLFYSTLYINGTQGLATAFAKHDIPLSFTSPLLLPVGFEYGLCVIADGLLTQDDFAGGHTVAASGIPGTVKMHLVVPKISRGLYIFPNDITASVFIQQKAVL